MDKVTFIQNWVIRTAPIIERTSDAVGVAEKVWDELSKKGYGDKKNAKSKPKNDAYSTLNGKQQRYFDKFWDAFNYKKGRERAIQRWKQLGDLKDWQYQLIIQAAAKESARDFNGLTRKMAEGWLADKRYKDDYSNAAHQQLQTTTRKPSHADIAALNTQRAIANADQSHVPTVGADDSHLCL